MIEVLALFGCFSLITFALVTLGAISDLMAARVQTLEPDPYALEPVLVRS